MNSLKSWRRLCVRPSYNSCHVQVVWHILTCLQSKRPLVIIAHSLGGLVTKQVQYRMSLSYAVC